ncbi:MAG TPA: type III-A CRISPR-associated protein Cas10/Csm1 [Dissulfurispiraceae bacterium]|nr:type III-A CRISPR-associated protein Cas10/Csm1 [Dissulfurispiraceae bacterium]
MDDTVLKIAVAAYFHDIGKFAERARMQLPKDYAENNETLYQPVHKSHYSHKHALFSAAVIEQMADLLPVQLSKAGWGEGEVTDSFINLAAKHHNPSTPLQHIVTVADRVSSGLDREKADTGYSVREYRNVRLWPLFDRIDLSGQNKGDDHSESDFCYPLEPLTSRSVFPVRAKDADTGASNYAPLWSAFLADLEKIPHKKALPLWFEHFDSLYMRYTSHIPSATIGTVPDISLYDHSRTTSALAAALYLYQRDTGSLNDAAIRDYEPQKFLLARGEFHGIQNFIFSEGGSTAKALAKLLRGRSFAVSLLTELAADRICTEIGLPMTALLLNAAGKFTMVVPNTPRALDALKKVDEEANAWLMRHYFGEASLGISWTAASCGDFTEKRYPALMQRLVRGAEERKCRKIDLNLHGGVVASYLDSFDNDLGICRFCGKRPAQNKIHDQSVCGICADHIYLGENLVRDKRIAVTAADAGIEGRKLAEPLFGVYQIAFVTGNMNEEASKGTLLRLWEVNSNTQNKAESIITIKALSGYVPKFTDSDINDEQLIDVLLHGEKSEATQNELFDAIREGAPKTFHHLAKHALLEQNGKYTGIEAMGVLKADVDNLGQIFGKGLGKSQSISRTATMSRQMNNFFAIHLPSLLQKEYPDTYTLFAGGDDLFLIGPWRQMFALARRLRDDFSRYTCDNKQITFSAGIALHKPGEPVHALAGTAETALQQAKDGGRNSVTMFGMTVKWDELSLLVQVKDKLETWLQSGVMNKAMLYRLNKLVEMAEKEQRVNSASRGVLLEDMECLKWRSRLTYSVIRTAAKNLKGEERDEMWQSMKQWLHVYQGACRIPLWQIIYERR